MRFNINVRMAYNASRRIGGMLFDRGCRPDWQKNYFMARRRRSSIWQEDFRRFSLKFACRARYTRRPALFPQNARKQRRGT